MTPTRMIYRGYTRVGTNPWLVVCFHIPECGYDMTIQFRVGLN
jgi:hypothetical protein